MGPCDMHRFIGGTLVDRYGSATVLFLLTAACLPLQDYALSHISIIFKLL